VMMVRLRKRFNVWRMISSSPNARAIIDECIIMVTCIFIVMKWVASWIWRSE
jgi:hypothetical protein